MVPSKAECSRSGKQLCKFNDAGGIRVHGHLAKLGPGACGCGVTTTMLWGKSNARLRAHGNGLLFL
eukprot:6187648-Pleurochrysis_carterae.AAC.4